MLFLITTSLRKGKNRQANTMYGNSNNLTLPLMSTCLEVKSNAFISVGSAGVQGLRGGMEDAHAVVLHPHSAFLGIFDGHAGHECSAYISEKLSKTMQEKAPPYMDDELTTLCETIDNMFLETQSKCVAGSTGTFAVIESSGDRSYTVTVANVGDSRIVLYNLSSGTVIPMTRDHKPDVPEEKNRIEMAGHYVEIGRVDGILAVSRAFGDSPFKEGDKPHSVIATPEIRRMQVTLAPGELVVVMAACDGLYEATVDDTEILHLLKSFPPQYDAAILAYQLINRAIHSGSSDNVSVTVALLGLETPQAPYQCFLPGAFRKTQDENFVRAYCAWFQAHGLPSLEQALMHRRSLFQDRQILQSFLSADDDDALFDPQVDLKELADALLAPLSGVAFICTVCRVVGSRKLLKSVRDTVESFCPMCNDDTKYHRCR